MDWIPFLEQVGLAVVSGAAGGGLLVWFGRAWIQSRFQLSVGKELARFQGELDAASSETRFEFERDLYDYAHFVRTKHRSLAELHRRILDAVSRTIRLARQHRHVPMIRSWSRAAVSDFLEEHEDFSKSIADEILADWDRDRDEAYVRVLDRLFEMQGEHARRSHARAHNFRLRYSLYFPDSIDEMAQAVLEQTSQILTEVAANQDHAGLHMDTRVLDTQFQALRRAMKREVGASAQGEGLSHPGRADRTTGDSTAHN